MKKPLPAPLIYKTLLNFPNVLLLCGLESPFLIALQQMLKKLKQHMTVPGTLTMGQCIPFHERLTILGMSITMETIETLMETPVFNYKQGQWVYVKYNNQCHLGVVQSVNYTEYLVNVRCLKPHSNSWWRLKPDIDVVWFIESNILEHAEHEPVIDQRGAFYKL